MSVAFRIVVPVFNAENWIEPCIRSIAAQAYKNFTCVIINDASTDNTGDAIDAIPYIRDDPRFSIIHNKENVKALQNIVDGFNFLDCEADPESVLMIVDGDDRLFSEYSLAIVNSAYEQAGCLISYGNHIHYPLGGHSNCEPFPAEVLKNRDYRKYKFVTSHLRTFKSKLWYNINNDQLKEDDGTYYGVGWDVAFMMPMLEMAGSKVLFIPNILYIYNRANPISDDVIRQPDQRRVEMRVRELAKYDILDD
jgi:glycosyltransferase involved in cell wall biosynthesis